MRECNRKIRLLKDKYNEITQKAGLDAHYDRMSVVKAPSTIDISQKNSIIKVGSEEVVEYKKLGKLNTLSLENEFGKLQTDEIIITNERLDHIQLRHPQDFELFEKYGVDTIHNPDVIIKDRKNSGTVFMIKRLPETNVNIVVRLALETDNKGLKNSVMTSYRVRDKNLKKLEEKNKILYKKE